MDQPPKARRGFAAMSPERRKAVAALGGAAQAAEDRSFSRNRDLAVAAGRKGGQTPRRPKAAKDAV